MRGTSGTANPTEGETCDSDFWFWTMSFGSGTYKVEGNKVVTRYDTSWHQLWTGRDLSSQVEIQGKTLTITTEPFKAAVDGKEVVVTTIWERVE